jgi:hypothetical protein
MENKTERELIEEKIRQNEEQIQLIKAQIEENDKIIKENKEKQKSLILKIIKTNLRIVWNYISYPIVFALKIPVYFLFLIFITVALFFNKNILAMMLNIYHNRYSPYELKTIFDYVNTLTNHLTFIFYIILLSIYVFVN